ncbi:acyltransferase family protein [Streptomyces sp. NPDC012403]|uniref:acyltransferase family protein n=1 Tax=Streptomyces sp. NPDC012403 TaxID=3364831 RepID=UPI0036EA199D
MDSQRVKRRQLDSLTGVRFPALFLVFANHIAMGFPLASMVAYENYQTYAGWIGKAGLTMFFMLSGFILAWIARDGDSVPLFYRRRFVRVVPLHWLTFGLSMLIFAYPAVSAEAAILNFFMLASWSSDPDIFSSMNAPSWSLTCIALFYLAFPLLHRIAKTIPRKFLWWVVGALMAVIISITAVVRAVVPADPMMHPLSPASSMDAFYYIQTFPLSRVPEFFLGILLARIVLTGMWPRPVRPLFLYGVLVAGFLVANELPREYRLVAAMTLPIFLFLGGLAAWDMADHKSAIAARPMQWLGNISFAFFLIHWPVIMFFFKLIGEKHLYSVWEFVGMSAVSMAVSIVLAWLLTIWVERPLIRLLAKPRASRGQAEEVPSGTPAEASAEAGPRVEPALKTSR